MSSMTTTQIPRTAGQPGRAVGLSGRPTWPSSMPGLWGVLAWVIVLLTLTPLVWLVSTALTGGNPGASLANFREVLGTGDFLATYVNSLVVSLSTTLFTVAFGVTSGYTLARTRTRSTRWMGIWIVLVRMAPPMGFALPFFLMMQKLQLLDTYPALVLVYLTVTLPFATWLMAGFFQSIPVELEEAARIDGCSRIRALFSVVLPAARPGIATVAIFSFIASWNEFFYPLVIAGRTTKTASLALQGYVSSAGIETGLLCAGAVLVLLPALLFTALAQKGLVRGLTHGAVK
ncbi:carbohydrate ABC transporter permease [Knoellia sp. S7-12]|uniref:carbohydrate ABC transporter permease n=1 Tax=Knoellia sp. S7-12 TaxID=3126698 RepID=UPI003369B205